MQFRENILAVYLNHNVYSDNLDFSNSKNLLTIYGNVKTESIEGNVEADNMIFDLAKQTLDISMFDEKRINVNLKE
jgi:lipopolysaccharide export system protein LptA